MSQNTKKIGYLSVMSFIIGTTIGAGIFFKNGELFNLAGGNLGLVISTWIIAALGIMALGLSLVELVSAQKSNRGPFEWTKTFVGNRFHKAAVNYNKYIFVPVTMLTIPIYATMTMDDALYAGFGYNFPGGWAVGLIAFAIFLWFMAFNLLSIKASEKLQFVTTIIKFIPLTVLPIIAFVYAGEGNGGSDISGSVVGINGASPYMILVAGIPAITFTYDGFQVAASLKEQMKDPKKLGSATVVSLGVITLAYLVLTLAFGLGSTTGTIFGIPFIMENHAASAVFNALIGVGMLGIVNGVTVGFCRQLASHTKIRGEMEEANFIGRIVFKKDDSEFSERERYLAAWLYVMGVSVILYLIFVPIATWGYSINDYGNDYPATSGTLYTLSDFLVNFTSLLFILILVTSVLGGVINRKTKKVKVEKSKYFLWTAWFSIIIFYTTGAWMVVAAFIDIFYLDGQESVSAIIKALILVGILAISFIPTFFPEKNYQTAK